MAAARRAGHTIGFVPTMGALHAGHASLVEASRRECGFTVASVFVNPKQFGPGEDFSNYPRSLEADVQLLGQHGADLVFAPPGEEVYAPDHATHVEVGGVALPWEGARRPGHFRGVATVVLKLFNMAAPDRAYFGQKDYQQLLVVRRMAADLDLQVDIRTCPIVRDPDGLALSSRNAYLCPSERRQALVLSRALRATVELAAEGEKSVAPLMARMQAEFATEPAVAVDYAAIVDASTLGPLERLDRLAVALVAAKVGPARLIDNILLPSA